MVEVFKTNVTGRDDANKLIRLMQETFYDYKVNFDLKDCDNILRVECTASKIQPSLLIDILKDFGFDAEILPDDDIPVHEPQFIKELSKS